MTPAPARSRSRTHARTAPHAPRRVSGPVSRRMVAAPAGAAAPRPAGGAARPPCSGASARCPSTASSTGCCAAARGSGRSASLLGGIVAMQVSLLKLNSGISRAVTTTTTLERQNADLEAAIARLTATDRIQTGAAGARDADAARGRRRLPERRAAGRLARRAPHAAAVRRGRRAAGQRRGRARLARRRRARAVAGRRPAPTAPATRRATAATPDAARPAGRARRRAGRPGRRRRRPPDHDRADDDVADVARRRRGRAPGLAVGLIERRIGLLFAVFLVMLLLAGARAGWLGVVRAERAAGGRRHAAEGRHHRARAARHDHRRQRHRARRLAARADDRRDAVPRSRTPAAAAAKLAERARRRTRTSCSSSSRGATPASSTSPARCPTRRALRAQKLHIEGLEFIPEYSREYPRDWMASQLLGNVGTDGTGLSGLEYRFDKAAARPRRRAPAGARRARRDDRAARGPAHGPGRPGAAHARRQHPGPHRGGPGRGRRGLAAQGRDRARDGPARRRHHRARQLAAREREQALRGAGLRDDEPRDRRDVRARLDVQGVHGRGRARGRQGHADDVVQPAAGAAGRRPRDQRRARARLGDARRRRASSRSPPTSAPR